MLGINYAPSFDYLESRVLEARLNGENLLMVSCLMFSALVVAAVSNNSDDDQEDDPVPNPLPQPLAKSGGGVYMILCTSTNYVYIGQTKNFKNRFYQHQSKLRNKKHNCTPMQNDYIEHGPESFQYHVLHLAENYQREEVMQIETQFIQKYRTRVYNMYEDNSRSSSRNGFYDRKHTDETRDKMSEAKKKLYEGKIQKGTAVWVLGVRYNSISEASRATGRTRDTLSRWLNKENDDRCVPADDTPGEVDSDEISNTGKPKRVSLFGTEYNSIAEAGRIRGVGHKRILKLLKENTEEFSLLMKILPWMSLAKAKIN